MAVSVLKLNLAPPSNAWRNNHGLIGWSALALGGLILAGSLGFTWNAYRSAAVTGKLAGSLTNKTRTTADTQSRVLAELRSVDVAKELPRWRLAERIYTERSLPWSRLTSELERSMVQDVRISSIQRNRSTDMKVQLKIKGEARSREAEAEFVETLQKNPFFEQIILEREGERQGGGVDFNYTLAVNSTPPPYQPLPKFAPPSKAHAAAAQPTPGKAPVAQPKGAPAPQPKAAAAPQSSGIAVPPRVTPAGPVRPGPVRPATVVDPNGDPSAPKPYRYQPPRFNTNPANPAQPGRGPGNQGGDQ
jgi:hypothetical protein